MQFVLYYKTLFYYFVLDNFIIAHVIFGKHLHCVDLVTRYFHQNGDEISIFHPSNRILIWYNKTKFYNIEREMFYYAYHTIG
jgi:hypothetical protein